MLQKKSGLLETVHGYPVPFAVRKDTRRQVVGSCIEKMVLAWFLELKEDLQCKKCPKRDNKAEEEEKVA